MPDERWNVVRVAREGNPVSEILAAAEECMANQLGELADQVIASKQSAT